MDRRDRHVRQCDVGGACNAISLSPRRDLCVVGGRDVLKIVSIVDNASAFSQQFQNMRTGRSNLTFSSIDVQWSPIVPSLLATAATNGKIVVWNVVRQQRAMTSSQDRILSDHTRTVNRVNWHGRDANVLLSASQVRPAG